MVNIADFAHRIRRRSVASAVFFFGGAMMMYLDFRSKVPLSEKGEMAFFWLMLMGVGVYFYIRSFEMPMKEIMQLAEGRNGMLTVTEITTELAISPDLAIRTLRQLQTRGLARISMMSLEKNLWEFPDSTRLPITKALEIAQEHGGSLSVTDLIAAGISLETAQQTLAALQNRGLLRSASAEERAVPGQRVAPIQDEAGAPPMSREQQAQ